MNSEIMKKIPGMAAAILVAYGLSPAPAWSQLPPVNMGRAVHQPGDNQYGNAAQKFRHPPAPVRTISVPVSGGGGGGGPRPYRKTRPKPKPDVSLQPIPADEPIAPPGFPPLPESVQLPGVESTTALTFNSPSGGSGGGGGGGSRSGGNPFTGKKQGYSHYTPGAFSPQKPAGNSSGNFGGTPAGMPNKVRHDSPMTMHQHYGHVQPGSFVTGTPTGSSPGYYKARNPQAKEDTFGAKDAGAGGGGPNLGKALKKMGKEPKLNDRVYGAESSAPEAPVPVQINQASTQDLSLPDDDFEYRRPPSKAGRYMRRTFKRIGNRARSSINQMPIPMRIPGGR